MRKGIKKFIVVIGSIILLIVVLIFGYEIKESLRIESIIKSHMVEENMNIAQAEEDESKDNETHITTGVQQIMIGTLCNNYDNALTTLLNIKKAGYDAIELNDFMVEESSLFVRLLTKFSGMPIGSGGKLDWKSLIEDSGLEVVSLHSNLNRIENNPEEVAEEAKQFGTDIVVITGMYQFDYSDLDEVEALAQRLNEAGKALSEEGIQLLYHNHNCEMQKVTDDKTAYDIIIEETDQTYVNFEFDSYWMADAGANVSEIMEKLGNRMKLWHINDRGCRKEGPYMTPILNESEMELGYGNMNLEELLSIAINNGVEGIILETHDNWIDNDPIKSIQISAEYLKKNLEDI